MLLRIKRLNGKKADQYPAPNQLGLVSAVVVKVLRAGTT
jgi:hypothetical protein